MKLIEILMDVLPKVGGWPKYAEILIQNEQGWIINPKLHGSTICKALQANDWEVAAVTKNEYEAALTASQQPAWNAEALPPVGTECELFDCEEWQQVKIKYVGDKVVVVDDLANPAYGERVFHIAMRPEKFRPIRTEAERRREKATSDMSKACSTREGESFMDAIYSAIAAGEIRGVKLEVSDE